jgi:hypothetical protein
VAGGRGSPLACSYLTQPAGVPVEQSNLAWAFSKIGYYDADLVAAVVAQATLMVKASPAAKRRLRRQRGN